MNSEHETGFVEWIDKPERATRPSSFDGLQAPPRRRSGGVWRNIILIVLLMFALIFSGVMLLRHG